MAKSRPNQSSKIKLSQLWAKVSGQKAKKTFVRKKNPEQLNLAKFNQNLLNPIFNVDWNFVKKLANISERFHVQIFM